jgi:hypothetical protein
MTSVHHKPIKKFYLDGVISDDSTIGRLKIEYIRLLVSQLRLSGYVPRLDIDPDFTIEYNHTKENFEFKLSIYGTYVGKRQSEWIIGLDGTEVVRTLPNKSKESSRARALRLNQK